MSRVWTVSDARTSTGSRSTFNPLKPSGWATAGLAHRSTATAASTTAGVARYGRAEVANMAGTFNAEDRLMRVKSIVTAVALLVALLPGLLAAAEPAKR